MRLIPLATAAALFASSAFAESTATKDHSGHGTMNHGTMDASQMDHSDMEGVHTMAKINSVDGDTYNVSHPPIPALKWPAMTMDLKLIEGAEVGTVAAGESVMLMLEPGADGTYGIKAIMPAE